MTMKISQATRKKLEVFPRDLPFPLKTIGKPVRRKECLKSYCHYGPEEVGEEE